MIAKHNGRTPDSVKIVVAGAGAVGCFVGGVLASNGCRVTFLGRPYRVDELRMHGLHITDFGELNKKLNPEHLMITSDPASALHDADIILVTVKCGATEEMGRTIAAHAPADAVVVTLQNGVGNRELLQQILPNAEVIRGVVEFHVGYKGQGHFRRGSTGRISMEARLKDVVGLLAVPSLKVTPVENINPYRWGKLLISLNISLNALSGMPLRDQLREANWRMLMADQLDETLAVLKAAKISPAAAPVSAEDLAELLRLSNKDFRRASIKFMKIDPEARGSMRIDLERGKPTEVDYFQGAVVNLAAQHGKQVPLCQATVDLIKEAEARKAGPPRLTPQDIRYRAAHASLTGTVTAQPEIALRA